MGDDVACSHKWSLTQAGTKVIKLPQSFLTGHTTLITQSTLGQRSSSPQKKRRSDRHSTIRTSQNRNNCMV